MGALLAGVYEGDVTIRELLHHGDFGLGTLHALDGEMLVLDAERYQLRSDGSATLTDPGELLPVRGGDVVSRRSHHRGVRAQRRRGSQGDCRRVGGEHQSDGGHPGHRRV